MKKTRIGDQILIRADADSRIGLGHIKRCLALCREIKRRRYRPVVVIKEPDIGVRRLLRSEKTDFIKIPKDMSLKEEAKRIKSIARMLGSPGIILDSYDLDAQYLGSIAASGVKTLMLDDRNYISRPDVDFLVNGNSYAPKLNYRLKERTKPFLGEDYYILDKAYMRAKRQGARKKVEIISICLSGVSFEIFRTLIDFLMSCSDAKMEIYFTLFQKKVFQEIKKIYGKKAGLFWFLNLSEGRLAKRLKKADMVFCSGGTIIYKAVASGCAVFAVPAVREQMRNIRALERKGSVLSISVNKGKGLTKSSRKKIIDMINDPGKREELVSSGSKILDGKGAERVADIILR